LLLEYTGPLVKEKLKPLLVASFHWVPEPEYDLGLPASTHSTNPLVTIEELYEILIIHISL
jgi:hypothetical protein